MISDILDDTRREVRDYLESPACPDYTENQFRLIFTIVGLIDELIHDLSQPPKDE